MTDEELDLTLKGFRAETSPAAAVIESIRGSVTASLEPVRPLHAPATLAGWFLACFAISAISGGLLLKMHGLQALSLFERCIIFPLLALLALGSGRLLAQEMLPGSPRRFSPVLIPFVSCLAFEAAVLALFNDYSLNGFVPVGMECLLRGLAFAMPAAAMSGLILYRGVVLHPVRAGMLTGTLAGLAGLTMLELQCPLLSVPHVGVWHAAVLLVSVAAGTLAGNFIAHRAKTLA